MTTTGTPAKRGRRGGRQKGTKNVRTLEIGKACMAIAPKAIVRLTQLMYCEDLATAKAACTLILAYAYGRPRERVEVTGAGQGPVRFTLALGDIALANGHSHNGNGSGNGPSEG